MVLSDSLLPHGLQHARLPRPHYLPEFALIHVLHCLNTCNITLLGRKGMGLEPDQVRCMIQDAWGWCTGMTQRDGMRREVGGGFRMGNTCTPMADS